METLLNFWMAENRILSENFPMKLQMGRRSRLKRNPSPERTTENEM